MPIYEFRCQKCNDKIEVFQKLSDLPPKRCKKCGGRLEKQFSRTSMQFKGEGWYVTDYGTARKGGVAETVDKELASPEPSTTTEKAKPKKTPAKKTGSDST